LRLVGHNLGLY